MNKSDAQVEYYKGGRANNPLGVIAFVAEIDRVISLLRRCKTLLRVRLLVSVSCDDVFGNL